MFDFRTYRTPDIVNRLRIAKFRLLDVMVTGVTGAGKSTTLNAFFQKTVAKEGDGVDPETMEIGDYSLNDYFRIWDTPGLGDGVAADKKHGQNIVRLLNDTYEMDGRSYGFIDMVLVIVEAGKRDLGTTVRLISDIILPNIPRDRVLILLNQADFAKKGYYWNSVMNAPEPPLLNFLEEQSASIQRRIRESCGVTILRPVYYSAKYSYNVQKAFDFIIDNMPAERRGLLK